ncbi:TlpA family protein disulfide reductase [Agromyces sp. ISL-38]|uniref:TlpA family protein disulfide reductase n=1 Tax=Agromyces sp. ISL-38 TaxID=2819107 RepID=UPI001BE92FC8|nr:TlpA disulfide reductase family protein [Agromyces sp. ISL-38]MBT2500715.1 TlpA family protein disulfide reductase [Agromyces sp. ISL-38]
MRALELGAKAISGLRRDASADGRLGRRYLAPRCAALAVASALLLTGCTSDPLAEQYREGSGKNYIAGDGTVSEFDEAQRGERIEFSGETVEGDRYDSADAEGDVQVVNFWYAGCAPCRAEAPVLQEVSQAFAGEGVRFVGVNVRDQAGTAASFEEKYGVTYPSILDVNSGEAQLAFSGPVPPAAVPTTIVLDQEGRVAARVLGQLNSASILESIIDQLLDEQA